MTDIKFISIAFAVVLLGAIFLGFHGSRQSFGSAPSGLPATVASQTTYTVTNAALQIAATSTVCSARIVSTSASPVMLGFTASAGTTTTGSVGLLQAASTTVVYDSGLYGCEQLSAFSYTSGSVNVVVTR